jgi:hypothetical protein
MSAAPEPEAQDQFNEHQVTEDQVAEGQVRMDHADEKAPLFGETDSAGLKQRWTDVQRDFVDDPQRAVQEADRLVSETMQSLSSRFAERKSSLEEQWSNGGVDTEDLRLALQEYRSFFHRLLTV